MYVWFKQNGANKLLWIRLTFDKMLRFVRVILYVNKYTNDPKWNTEAFAVKIGVDEQSRTADVTKAQYCANDVSTYPGESKKISNGYYVERKDIYCHGPIEGKFVYLCKHVADSVYMWEDALLVNKAIVFGELV